MPDLLPATHSSFSAVRRPALAEPGFLVVAGVYLLALPLHLKVLTSVAPAVLVALGAVQPGSGARLRLLTRNGPARLMLLVYPLLLLSGLWSEDVAEWRHVVTRYLPFVALPLAFGLARPFAARQRYGLGVAFVLAVTGVSVATVGQFILHYAQEAYLIGRSHTSAAASGAFNIHFGLMMALAVFFAAALAGAAPALGRRWHRPVLWVCAGLLVVSLHVLAYRTGLLVLYVALVVAAARALARPGRRWLGVALLAGLTLAPVAAYYTLEPAHERLYNTIYDVSRFQTGADINDFSVSMRLAAWSNAAALVGQHWAIGVAPADVAREMARQYEWRSFGLRPENRVLLHNQYLYALLSLGVPGLAWLLALLFAPFRRASVRADPCAAVFLVGAATTMLVDTPFSLHMGLHLVGLLYALLLVGPRQRELLRGAGTAVHAPTSGA